jgi:hypothetical protein
MNKTTELNIFSKIFANLPNNSLTPQNHAEKSDMFTYLYGVCKLFTDIRCKLSKTEIKDRWSFSAIEKLLKLLQISRGYLES